MLSKQHTVTQTMPLLCTDCGDRVIAHTNIESLCYKPETHATLHVNYTSIKKQEAS